jgi:hypothetical protein
MCKKIIITKFNHEQLKNTKITKTKDKDLQGFTGKKKSPTY